MLKITERCSETDTTSRTAPHRCTAVLAFHSVFLLLLFFSKVLCDAHLQQAEPATGFSFTQWFHRCSDGFTSELSQKL